MREPTINTGRTLAGLLWPEFVVVGECVFLRSEWRDGARLHCCGRKRRTQTESDSSHTHIMDFFSHNAGTHRKPFFRRKHPDFQAACELGKTICRMWATKLAAEFPQWDFRVYYHGFDPVVRFHRVRRGKRNWMEPSDCAEAFKTGEVMIIDTRDIRKAQLRRRRSRAAASRRAFARKT